MGIILKEMGVVDHSIHMKMEEDTFEPDSQCIGACAEPKSNMWNAFMIG